MEDGVTNEFLGWFATTSTKTLCLLCQKFTLHFTTDIQDKFFSWIGYLHFTTQYLPHMHVFLPFLLNKTQLKRILTNTLFSIVQANSISTSIFEYFGNGLCSLYGMESAVSLAR